jgi:hypothetical protein
VAYIEGCEREKEEEGIDPRDREWEWEGEESVRMQCFYV